MNLLEMNLSEQDIIDICCATINNANNNGFNGFGGYCGRASLIINEVFFDSKQENFACFNDALANQGYHIGHVACMVEIGDESYFIIDADAEIKEIEDIQHWGSLDPKDQDYINLFQEYGIDNNEGNFESFCEVMIDKEFIQEHFDCSDIDEQKKILNQCLIEVLKNFKNKINRKNKLK